MSSQASDFFSIPSKGKASPAPATPSEESFFDIPNKNRTWVKPEPPSVSEQLDVAPGIFAQEAGAQLYSLPSTTAETYRFLGGKLRDLGIKQAAKEGREITPEEAKFTENVVNYIPDLIKDLGEKFPNLFPNINQAREKVGKRIEKNEGVTLPKEPRGKVEKFAKGAGSATPILLTRGSGLLKGAAIGTSAVTEASNLSEKGKIAGNLTIPALTALIESIVKKRYIPPKGEATQLYEEGKRLGMTDKQLAPILATEKQVELFGPLAAGKKKTRLAFEETGNVLGNVIDDMQNRPQNFNTLPPTIEQNLLTEFGNIEHDIRTRSHALSPQNQSTVDFIQKSISDINTNGSSPRQLLGTWREINKIKAGKSEAARLKKPLLDAIEAVDPALAKDLQSTNKLYSKYVENLKEINPTQFNDFINAGELQELIAAVFTGDLKGLGKQTLNLISVNQLRRLSSNILVSPRAQSLVRNFGQAVRDGRQASAVALGNQLKNYVQKELPEEYNNIDWEALGITD